MNIIRTAALAAITALAGCATHDTREGTVTKIEWRVNLVRSGSVRVIESFKSDTQAKAWAACIAKLNDLSPNAYECRELRFYAVVEADPVPPPTCTAPQPPNESQTMACPSGTVGSWTQTRSYVAAPYPTCWTPGPWAPTSPPAGACTTPPPTDRPNADSTGPTSGDLKAMGGTTITVDGTVLEKFAATGQITIKANNVTLRNFTVQSSSSYGIRVESGKGAVIEDGEIFGMSSAGIYGGDFTARRLHIHDSGADAIKPTRNALIEDSYLEKLGYLEDAHADGVQMVSGSNVTMRGNNFYMPHDAQGYRNSQCIIIQTNNGPVDNILIEKNWLNGGGYCVQIREKDDNGVPTNVRIMNNRFGDDYQYGPWVLDGDVLVCGNVDDETGKPLGQGNVATCPATKE
jgi:hypothetical protein